MKNKSHLHVLLVEILIAVMFFGLASTVLLKTYAAAYVQSNLAAARGTAMIEAQDLADRLAASGSDEEILAEAGFAQSGASWSRSSDGVDWAVTLQDETFTNGVLRHVVIEVTTNGKALLTLPADHYQRGAAHE